MSAAPDAFTRELLGALYQEGFLKPPGELAPQPSGFPWGVMQSALAKAGFRTPGQQRVADWHRWQEERAASEALSGLGRMIGFALAAWIVDLALVRPAKLTGAARQSYRKGRLHSQASRALMHVPYSLRDRAMQVAGVPKGADVVVTFGRGNVAQARRL